MQDYKCLKFIVVICSTLVNTQTDTQTTFDRISSPVAKSYMLLDSTINHFRGHTRQSKFISSSPTQMWYCSCCPTELL